MSKTKSGRGRVAIIGAGPGGLTAAVGLCRIGFDVTVFERAAQLKSLGGGVALWPPPVKALEELGVDIVDLGAGSTMGYYRPDGRHLVPVVPEAENADFDHPMWMGLLRSQLYARIQDAVPDGVIQTGKRCVGCESNDEGATAYFADGSAFEADLIVGADGLNSVVRRHLVGDDPIRDHALTAWIGHCDLDHPDRSAARLALDPRGLQGSYTPMVHEGREGFHWWLVEPCSFDEGSDAKSHIASQIAHFAEPLPALVEATVPENIIKWEVKDRPPLDHWFTGRLVVLGDAAHPVSPYAGYGAGMAIVDAFHLACQLSGHDPSDPLQLEADLGRYEESRRDTTTAVVQQAFQLGKLFHTQQRWKRRLRDFLLDHTGIPRLMISRGYTKGLAAEYGEVIELARRLPAEEPTERQEVTKR